jgi:prevent-host-death family protein
MTIASATEVKSRFSAFLKASEGGPVVVTRNGRPVAVLIGVQDEEEIENLLMAYSPRLRAILEESRQQIRDGQGIRHEEFWSEIEPTGPAKRPGGKRAKKAAPSTSADRPRE